MKNLLSIVLSLTMVFALSPTAFADSFESNPIYVNEWEVEVVPSNTLTGTYSAESNTQPRFVNDFRYRKVNVKTTEKWSLYKRVSDNLVTGPKEAQLKQQKWYLLEQR